MMKIYNLINLIKSKWLDVIYQDYIDLYKNRKIICEDLNTDQIQPSSIDLSLSNECYEIKYSFLAPKNKVRDKLEDLIIKKST